MIGLTISPSVKILRVKTQSVLTLAGLFLLVTQALLNLKVGRVGSSLTQVLT
jgi:hypothetical protein